MMSDYWDHPEYGELEEKLEQQIKTTRKWMGLHDEAVERELTLTTEHQRLKGLLYETNNIHYGGGKTLGGSCECLKCRIRRSMARVSDCQKPTD